MIDGEKLGGMYKNKMGIRTAYGRTYYASKPRRRCNNCHFALYDRHSLIVAGCEFFENTIKVDGMTPTGTCIPVWDDSFMAEAHSECVREWILKNLLEGKE